MRQTTSPGEYCVIMCSMIYILQIIWLMLHVRDAKMLGSELTAVCSQGKVFSSCRNQAFSNFNNFLLYMFQCFFSGKCELSFHPIMQTERNSGVAAVCLPFPLVFNQSMADMISNQNYVAQWQCSSTVHGFSCILLQLHLDLAVLWSSLIIYLTYITKEAKCMINYKILQEKATYRRNGMNGIFNYCVVYLKNMTQLLYRLVLKAQCFWIICAPCYVFIANCHRNQMNWFDFGIFPNRITSRSKVRNSDILA